MASHELRTPLSIIRGYVEFIQTAPNLTEETKGYATKIDVSARDLDLLVGDILDVNKIEQGRMSFKFEVINPFEIIDNIVSSLVLPAKDKGLLVSFNASDANKEAKISVDRERLKQVLVNIIGNAVKYTKTGEVKVTQYVEDRKLYIRVSDTGVGMSADEQKRLFEKFYRIRTKETEDIRGTGLGLWITGQIIKEMKGSISVESIKGVGSHFIVSFPIYLN
jgi:signal transduction histidine kinase